MQQYQEYESEDDEKITVAEFAGVGSIDLGSDLGDEISVSSLESKPIDESKFFASLKSPVTLGLTECVLSSKV